MSSSPRWQYYSGAGSQRIVISQDRLCAADHFASQLLSDRKHVTRVSVNNNSKQCYQSRSLSDLRLLLPDVTTEVDFHSF